MKTETGNLAAIRDALNEAVSVLHACLDPDFPPTYECLRATIDKCEAALAEPRRNCDVGTAEEQFKRHCKWRVRTKDFSCSPVMCRECFARWLQEPYKEGGAK